MISPPFMRFVLSVFILLLNAVLQAQTDTSHKNTGYYSIKLNDGTTLVGNVTEEKNEQITINDKNIGHVTISLKNTSTVQALIIGESCIFTFQDGNKYSGKLLEYSSSNWIVETSSFGKININPVNIKSFYRIQPGITQTGRYGFPNPNATRYFFAPSAIPLKKGEGYYQNAYLLANSASVGLTDNITIGGGILLPFLVYITPKVAFKVSDNFYAGGGVLFANSLLKIEDEGLGAGIAYGLATYGNEEHNITIGTGYGFIRNGKGFQYADRPIMTVNGMTRAGKRIALVTENWIVPIKEYKIYYDQYGMEYTDSNNFQYKYEAFFSYGFRIMSEKSTFDIGFINSKEVSKTFYVGIPYIDYVFKF